MTTSTWIEPTPSYSPRFRFWSRNVILPAASSCSPHSSLKSPTSSPFLFVRAAKSEREQLFPGPLLQSGRAVIPSLMLSLTNFSGVERELLALQDRSSKIIRPPMGETWDFRHLRSCSTCVMGRCSSSLMTSSAVTIGAISPSCTLPNISISSTRIPCSLQTLTN
jgi:hypothetical protein